MHATAVKASVADDCGVTSLLLVREISPADTRETLLAVAIGHCVPLIRVPYSHMSAERTVKFV
jgi:hypothetical protein